MDRSETSRRNRRVLLTVLLLFLAAGAALAVFLVKISRKDPVSPEVFSAVLTDRGISCEDITADLQPEADDMVLGLLGRTQSFRSAYFLQGEYYQLVSDSAAMRFYASIRASLEAKKGNVSAQTSTALGNYAIYTLSTNGSYYYAAQVGQTVVFFSADGDCKDAVREMAGELGY